MTIRKITYECAKSFIDDNTLIIKPIYQYYALFNDNDKILSVLGAYVSIGKTHKIKLHCNYTPAELRNHGYFSMLLNQIMKIYAKDMNVDTFYADCTDFSKGIYEKMGFKAMRTKKFKRFNITTMRYKYGKTTN